ncbi:hypothetical protein SK803_29195 [Lentzea sp. BCCO 10_0856]|uniref:HEAT repeat-containing protein n=1 Tax=Lentzea miocenica TaxID=3095431 RepID=A0ABU4T8Q5_9PSEU|nr:hypothetical protein [Lentzea sp. BCCO 10_0856]MDX8034313.1 hypothetical protein [Lentzea sp. BCCO 10_0856]
MTLLDRVRAAMDNYRYVTETSALGGVVFECDGDPLVGVVNDEVIIRVEGGGWAAVTGDLAEWIERSSEVVIAEWVVRWHEELGADSIAASRAMLGLVHHEPDREQLQRLLLDHTCHPELRQLAVTCLGHVGRLDGEVLPEVVPRLRELLDDPDIGGAAENALGDIEHFSRR